MHSYMYICIHIHIYAYSLTYRGSLERARSGIMIIDISLVITSMRTMNYYHEYQQ